MVPLSPWNESLVEELKRLIAAGYSAQNIAVELGYGLTRNAVLGKINRLGLSKPREPKEPGEVRPRRYKPRMVRRLMPPLQPEQAREPLIPEPVAKPRRLQLLALQDHHCRWPCGDPRTRPFYFCGADVTTTGQVYCDFHFAKAYVRSKR